MVNIDEIRLNRQQWVGHFVRRDEEDLAGKVYKGCFSKDRWQMIGDGEIGAMDYVKTPKIVWSDEQDDPGGNWID